jgi:PAS domain S-box-containing protein
MGLSSDRKIIEFNPEAEKLFGYKRDEVIGKTFIELFIDDSMRIPVDAELRRLLAGGAFPNHFSNLVKSVDGSLIKIEWTALKLLDDAGNLSGIIAIGENITRA